MDTPPIFAERMRRLLGPQAEAFLASLDRPPFTGLRVNTLKLSPNALRDLVPWPLDPVPWCEAGFIVAGEGQPGRHPYHAAGLYYVQEPSAMAPAQALAPRPGELVLDLAAAPGGKATQLAALMGDSGLLVANEVEASRRGPLAANLERWGARSAVISGEWPQRLVERWGAVFDRVLVDAPCSGEGMFRKSEAAVAQWSEKLVQGCALRQRNLLAAAAALVRPGGSLAYSTCTFAPEEDEDVIARFLDTHPDFALEPIHLPAIARGRPEWATANVRAELAGAARLWPHLVPGEGHFVALLRKVSGTLAPARPAHSPPAPRPAVRLWREFAARLAADPAADRPLALHGSRLYAVPDTLPLDGLHVARPGLWLGDVRGDRFEPSHALALALRPAELRGAALPILDLAPDDARLARYLQGHPLEEAGEAGWLLITVSGFPIGWGRRAQGIIKNAYPKGLRFQPSAL
ncbi:MAG: RsmF rRNA methyltransferase first C-terminal domain-containing protein [Anaerolineae bacterium]